ncbi:MAG: histidine phosphatase family protein [Planctomycetota bacterium]
MRILVRPPDIPDDPNAPAPERAAPLGLGVRVWLIRHAEVHDDWQDKAYGNLDVPLSPTGERKTLDLAASFARTPLARVASSDLSRALLLGKNLSATTSAPLTVDPRLREVWRGDWQGLSRADFRARWESEREAFAADPWNWKGHGGESDAEIFARAWAVLVETARAARDAESPTIALATHYNVIRALVTRAVGLRPSQSFSFRNDTARASLLVDEPGGWVLARANVASPDV